VLSDGLADHTQAFDFRSSRFGVDAQTLARVTGRSVPRCRQELFIAEGDMALAYEWLVQGHGAEDLVHGRH